MINPVFGKLQSHKILCTNKYNNIPIARKLKLFSSMKVISTSGSNLDLLLTEVMVVLLVVLFLSGKGLTLNALH